MLKYNNKQSLLILGSATQFAITFLLTFIVAKILGISFTKIFTNILTKSEMGQYRVITAASALLLTFTSLGFPSALNRFVVRYRIREEYRALKDILFSSFLLFLMLEVFTILILVLLYICFNIIPWFLRSVPYIPVLLMIAIIILAQILNTLCYVISAALYNGRYYGNIIIMRVLLQIPFGLFYVLVLHLGIWGLVLGLMSTEVIVAIYSTYIMIRDIGIGKISIAQLKKLLSFSFPSYVNGFLMMGFDLLVLAFILYIDPVNGKVAIALYNYGAMTVVNLILLAGHVFRMVYRPIIYRYFEQQQFNKMQYITKKILKLFLVIILTYALLIFAFSPLLVQFFTQSSYLPSIKAIPLLLVAVIFQYLPNIVSYGHALYYKNYWNLIAGVISLILATTIGYFVIRINILVGISIVYAILRGCYFIGLTIVSQHYFKVHHDIISNIKITLSIIIAIGSGYILNVFVFNFLPNYYGIIISFTIASLIFIGLVFILKIITKEDIKFLVDTFGNYLIRFKKKKKTTK